MRTAQDWLDEYSASHEHAVNRRFHFACIPPIVFAVICALKAIPLGTVWVNPATVTMALALAYYAVLSLRLAAGLAIVFALMYALALAVEAWSGERYIWVAAAIFVVGWIGQFIGHHVEGKRPSFFKDVQFLLIGPMWELAHVYAKLGIAVERGRTAPR